MTMMTLTDGQFLVRSLCVAVPLAGSLSGTCNQLYVMDSKVSVDCLCTMHTKWPFVIFTAMTIQIHPNHLKKTSKESLLKYKVSFDG